MKKLLLSFFVLLVIILSFSSCGYNEIMFDHLSDPDNYEQYNATIINIYYEYDENVLIESFQGERIADLKNVYLDVLLSSKEEIAPFYGVSKDSLDNGCAEYPVRLKIISENCRILIENDFFNNVKAGNDLTVKASNWIYQDGQFFYVIAISYGEIAYLNELDGLKNIVDMMHTNKSLF